TDNPFLGEGNLFDVFFVEQVLISFDMLKNFDIPIGCAVTGIADVYDNKVASEWMEPDRLIHMPGQLFLGVDIKYEDSSLGKMLVSIGHGPLPIVKTQDVVDGIIDAEHDVESLLQAERHHILARECRSRDFPPGNSQHAAGQIESI